MSLAAAVIELAERLDAGEITPEEYDAACALVAEEAGGGVPAGEKAWRWAGKAAGWDESKHPRRDDGKFGSGGGSAEPDPSVGQDEDAPPERQEPSSAGEPSEADAEQDWKENGVRARAFKAWFGDWENDPENASKIVTPDGEPRKTIAKYASGEPVVFYHGSKRSFDAFNDGWAFFSPSESYAENYKGYGPDAKLYKCYLNVRNPIDLRDIAGEGEVDPQEVLDALKGYGIEFDPDIDQPGSGEIHQVLEPLRDEIRRQALELGYDGLIQNENYDGQESQSIAVFDPRQIKSADNRGTFDPRERDMAKSWHAPGGTRPLTPLARKSYAPGRTGEGRDVADYDEDDEGGMLADAPEADAAPAQAAPPVETHGMRAMKAFHKGLHGVRKALGRDLEMLDESELKSHLREHHGGMEKALKALCKAHGKHFKGSDPLPDDYDDEPLVEKALDGGDDAPLVEDLDGDGKALDGPDGLMDDGLDDAPPVGQRPADEDEEITDEDAELLEKSLPALERRLGLRR